MILVTGGLGYLGGRITEHLIKCGEKVRIGTSRPYPEIPEQLRECDIVNINLLDKQSLESACKDVTLVIHLAALNAPSCSQHPEESLMINGLGTFNLISSAISQNVENFLYFSTVHVYGSPLCGMFDETSLPRPLHPYSITKRLGEDYVLEADAMGRISGAVFRISNAVGSPLTKNENCWMLIANDFCKQVILDKRIKLYSSRYIKRDYLPIVDICHAVAKFIRDRDVGKNAKGEIINISNEVSMSLGELSKLVADRSKLLLGYTPAIEYSDNGITGGDWQLLISNQKAKHMGIQLTTDISSEIDALLLNCEKWFQF